MRAEAGPGPLLVMSEDAFAEASIRFSGHSPAEGLDAFTEAGKRGVCLPLPTSGGSGSFKGDASLPPLPGPGAPNRPYWLTQPWLGEWKR